MEVLDLTLQRRTGLLTDEVTNELEHCWTKTNCGM